METVNQKILKRLISHLVYLERFKTGEVLNIMTIINQIDRDLMITLNGYSDRGLSKYRIDQMKNAVKEIYASGDKVAKKALESDLKDLLQHEIDFNTNLFVKEIPSEIVPLLNIVSPESAAAWKTVKTRPFANGLFDDWVKKVNKNRLDVVGGVLEQGYAEGKTIQDMTRQIFGTRKLRYTDGLLQGTRNQIASLVRTAINHTASVAREEVYDENKKFLNGVEWISTLDGKTTLICASLDGLIDYYDGPKQLNGKRPPAHWGCRSATAPVVKSLKELGIVDNDLPDSTRASMDGQVPESMKYNDWLQTQPAKVQRDVLGARRYELWKDNDYPSLDKFVSDNRVLTLGQLKQRDVF